MARCGCQTSCGCVHQSEAPLAQRGNGSVQQPYVHYLSSGGRTGCAAVTHCVSQNLGAGLTYDQGSDKIQLKLSGNEGQNARFGSDNGLLVTAGTGATPETCVRGIASLPPAPNVLGADSLAGLHNPYSSPHGVDYCLANNIDIIGFKVATSSDDVGVVSDYWDHRITEGRSSIYVSQDIRQLNSSTIKSVYNYAGSEDDPVSYQATTVNRTDRRGGWYGWLAQRYYQPLATEFLARIQGKAVALMDCSPDPANAAYPESIAISGAIRAVLQYCAQSWAMIAVRELANATTVKNQGITPVMMPLRPATWGTTALPYTVADLTNAGIKWIILNHRYADSVFTTYRDAGLNVLMLGSSRHSERTRVASLGIRGAFQLDPVYYRGPSPYGYRTETDAWEQRRMSVGQLTYMTDQQSVISGAGFVRGKPEAAEQGLIIPANFGNGIGRPAILCGWECPLTNPTSYTISWDMKWNTLASSATLAKMGLLFGAATDDEPYGWPQNNATYNPVGYPEGQKTLYRFWQRQNGEIGLGKWSTPTAAMTTLATVTSPTLAAGVWNTYTLTVTPTQITVTRTLSDGTKYTVTAADSQYRGGYFWVEKEETYLNQPANPFEGKVRNVTYTAGS